MVHYCQGPSKQLMDGNELSNNNTSQAVPVSIKAYVELFSINATRMYKKNMVVKSG